MQVPPEIPRLTRPRAPALVRSRARLSVGLQLGMPGARRNKEKKIRPPSKRTIIGVRRLPTPCPCVIAELVKSLLRLFSHAMISLRQGRCFLGQAVRPLPFTPRSWRRRGLHGPIYNMTGVFIPRTSCHYGLPSDSGGLDRRDVRSRPPALPTMCGGGSSGTVRSS